MTSKFFVVFNKNGVDRMHKTDRFDLKAGEYATVIELEVPDEVFSTPPVPSVRISIPTSMIRRTIEATVTGQESSA